MNFKYVSKIANPNWGLMSILSIGRKIRNKKHVYIFYVYVVNL